MTSPVSKSLSGIASPSPGTYGPVTAPFFRKTKAAKEIHETPPQHTTVPGKYLYTHSTKTDSGMYFHLHDERGKTFHSVVHPSGTFTEMQSDGSYVEGVTGNKKTSVDGEITTGSEGNHAVFSNADMEIRVTGHLKITAKSITIEAGDTIGSKAGGTHTIIGKKVDINP